MDKDRSKKHTRREAIKYGAKIGLGAAIWGTVGNILGRGYKTGRDFYRKDIKPTIDTVKEGTDKVKELSDDLNRRLNPWYEPKPEIKKEQPKLTRRGFLKSLAWQAHEHPVAAGTAVGATYGAGKYAITGLSNHLTKRQIAILKDENADDKKRIALLEHYKEGVEKDLQKKDARIGYLESELKGVNEALTELRNKQGKLEERVSKGKVPGESEEILLSLGIVGLLVSAGFGSSIITGNIISGIEKSQLFPITAVIFVLSLILIFSGIKKRG